MENTTRLMSEYTQRMMMQGDGAMARRKGVVSRRLIIGALGVLFVGLLMVSRVFLTTQVTDARARIADLESRREFLEAGHADLQERWNLASSAAEIQRRAGAELGMVVPETPGPVIVLQEMEQGGSGPLLTLGQEVVAAVEWTMVSLQPAAAMASTVQPEAE